MSLTFAILATSDATTLVSVYKTISNPFGVSSAANVDTTNMAHITVHWLDGVLEGKKGKYALWRMATRPGRLDRAKGIC